MALNSRGPRANLESQLPELLSNLSDTQHALLADDNGLYYATAGFLHESAEEIAALAGDIISLSRRHTLLLKQNLNLTSTSGLLVIRLVTANWLSTHYMLANSRLYW
ncbi:roadblock/LC7 domain-containing protein [Paludibacterium denitrificans]|uniref:roadblock/LC7 domain-containing protein n=1 Tax=Paludibacterium denitrificans TaxID=2675226 RepID=UPI0035E45A21